MKLKFRLPLLSVTILIAVLSMTACKTGNNDPENGKDPEITVDIPTFDANNAYNFIETQLAFGPRVPNTPAQDSCAAWMAEKFREFGARVIVQEDQVRAYTGEMLNMKNIIASYNPDKKRRVLLCAHWDSRHISDYDPSPENYNKPVPGADDGGSGVGVLLEVARLLNEYPLEYMGIDIVLFDVEDHGQPSDGGGFPMQEDTWCLGSQYWSKNPHVPGYKANYGILLDMVGSRGARFTKEGTSMKFAADIMNKVWKEARSSGYSAYFVLDRTREIIDDHLYVNEIAKIPTIDIINRPAHTETGFGDYWHTQNDNIDVIDKNTLRAVGQTVLNVIYKESVMAL
ncbi:MAG: M28 family peptidase [Bacteroidota bacterium]